MRTVHMDGSPGHGVVSHDLRRQLIEALQLRGWTHLDAERAAARVSDRYEKGAGGWLVRLRKAAGNLDLYQVARYVNAASIFDSLLERQARDVADALNEFEDGDSEPTDTR